MEKRSKTVKPSVAPPKQASPANCHNTNGRLTLCCIKHNPPLTFKHTPLCHWKTQANVKHNEIQISHLKARTMKKTGGTVQKSTVYLGLEHLGLSFFISLNHQLFKNEAYVGYFCHFVICCICVFVNLYLCISIGTALQCIGFPGSAPGPNALLDHLVWLRWVLPPPPPPLS